MGCNYDDADFGKIEQLIGNGLGKKLLNHFLNIDQWDSYEIPYYVFLKFNDVDGFVEIGTDGYYQIEYEEQEITNGYDEDGKPITETEDIACGLTIGMSWHYVKERDGRRGASSIRGQQKRDKFYADKNNDKYREYYDDYDWNHDVLYDIARDIGNKINWERVDEIVSSYSITSPTPEFLNAFDRGMEKQVVGYDRNSSLRTRPSEPEFLGPIQ